MQVILLYVLKQHTKIKGNIMKYLPLPLEPTDTGVIEILQGVSDNHDIIITVIKDNKYMLNVVDTNTDTVLFNGYTDNLLALLNTLQQL